jgi:hypothetical protein
MDFGEDAISRAGGGTGAGTRAGIEGEGRTSGGPVYILLFRSFQEARAADKANKLVIIPKARTFLNLLSEMHKIEPTIGFRFFFTSFIFSEQSFLFHEKGNLFPFLLLGFLIVSGIFLLFLTRRTCLMCPVQVSLLFDQQPLIIATRNNKNWTQFAFRG